MRGLVPPRDRCATGVVAPRERRLSATLGVVTTRRSGRVTNPGAVRVSEVPASVLTAGCSPADWLQGSEMSNSSERSGLRSEIAGVQSAAAQMQAWSVYQTSLGPTDIANAFKEPRTRAGWGSLWNRGI